MHCPLCHTSEYRFYHQDVKRSYQQCLQCSLVFVPPAQRLSAESEKAEYDLHKNHPQDVGYRKFLRRVADPVNVRFAPGSRGLDYGSGPCPVLAMMLTECGFDMACYDPFYESSTDVLAQCYDFITCTEVVEHMHQPGDELRQLINKLNPGGQLFVMTKRVIDQHRFKTWHYKNDPTHVCFFSDDSFEWFANQHQMQLSLLGPDVVVLTRPGSPAEILSL